MEPINSCEKDITELLGLQSALRAVDMKINYSVISRFGLQVM